MKLFHQLSVERFSVTFRASGEIRVRFDFRALAISRNPFVTVKAVAENFNANDSELKFPKQKVIYKAIHAYNE